MNRLDRQRQSPVLSSAATRAIQTALCWGGLTQCCAGGRSWCRKTLKKRYQTTKTWIPPVPCKTLAQEAHRICQQDQNVTCAKTVPGTCLQSARFVERASVHVSKAVLQQRLMTPNHGQLVGRNLKRPSRALKHLTNDLH